ncbi:hypothetical protein ACP4OV_011158 [Aristida adscensionis]
MANQVVVGALVSLLLLLLGVPSHAVCRSLEGAAAAAAPPSIVRRPQLRTGYHFQPLKNWMNDPNGPMFYKGWYHMFYQYNPNGSAWVRNIVWGHSVSKDLINWISLEPAISPSIESDKFGCWSGSATILPNGTPMIVYTGINKVDGNDTNFQVQNVAFPKDPSDPLLQEWVKPNYNPIISPKHDLNATQFRDPTTVWRGPDKQWRLLVGNEKGQEGRALVYRSSDLRTWQRAEQPLHSAMTAMWECPDFFPVAAAGSQEGLDVSSHAGTKHVLKSSLPFLWNDYYTIGTYDDTTDTYYPDDPSGDYNRTRYDYGTFYASKTFYDPVKQRRILWGWVNESDTAADDAAKGWAGIQSIPRKIWLDAGGKQLVQWPIEEVESLRGNPIRVDDKVVAPGQHMKIKMYQASQADVEVVFEIPSLEKAELFDSSFSNDAQKLCNRKGADVGGGVGPFGLWVLASSDVEERTAVFFRIFVTDSGKPVVLMCSDTTRSSLSPDLYKPRVAGYVDTDIKDGKISLRTLIDRSVIESFGAGGKTCILSRVYPSLAQGRDSHLFVFNNGEGHIKIHNLTAWEIYNAHVNE